MAQHPDTDRVERRSAPGATPPSGRGTLNRGWLKALALAVALAALVMLGRRAGGLIPVVAERLARMGAWGPIAFIGVYVVSDLVLIPGSVLSLAGGALFGFIRGTLLVFVASTLGAVAAFLVARYLARGYVQGHIGASRLAAIDRAIARKGFRLVVLLRLSPVVPYSVLNYSLGLTRVRFRDFLLGSVGMLPGTVLYVYYGKVAGEMAALAGGSPAPHDVAYWILVAVGLAATIAASVLVTRTARRALQEAPGVMDGPGDPPAPPTA